MLIYAPGRDPLAFFTNLARTYGDVVYLRMGGEHLFLLSDPRHIRDVLVTHQRSFIKGARARVAAARQRPADERGRRTCGSAPDQPAFHHRIAAYASVMTEYADRLRTAGPMARTSTWRRR